MSFESVNSREADYDDGEKANLPPLSLSHIRSLDEKKASSAGLDVCRDEAPEKIFRGGLPAFEDSSAARSAAAAVTRGKSPKLPPRKSGAV